MLEAMRAARFAILIFGRGRTRSTRRRRTAWLGRRDSNNLHLEIRSAELHPASTGFRRRSGAPLIRDAQVRVPPRLSLGIPILICVPPPGLRDWQIPILICRGSNPAAPTSQSVSNASNMKVAQSRRLFLWPGTEQRSQQCAGHCGSRYLHGRFREPAGSGAGGKKGKVPVACYRGRRSGFAKWGEVFGDRVKALNQPPALTPQPKRRELLPLSL